MFYIFVCPFWLQALIATGLALTGIGAWVINQHLGGDVR